MVEENIKETNNDKPDETAAKRVMQENGLKSEKYTNSDGSVNYDKLNKSKTGWKILGMLGNAMAGFGSAMTGHNFSTDSGLANYQMQRRQDVIDTQKGREENKYQDARESQKYKDKSNVDDDSKRIADERAQKHTLERDAKQQEYNEKNLKTAQELQEKIYELELTQTENIDNYYKNMDSNDAKKIGEGKTLSSDPYAGRKALRDDITGYGNLATNVIKTFLPSPFGK